ncbi:MAG TPA: UDP-N-acetylmuramate dehydrogenase [Caulobacteraceae bacterium]
MDWRDELPPVRGRLMRDAPLAPYTWFRVGGPADLLFLPADEADLAALLQALPADVPRTVLGVGSNVIIRDGGLAGLTIRLAGRPFGEVHVAEDDGKVAAAAGALDAMVARTAAKAGYAGLEFYAGIPGTVGGAITMNAGCYGAETRDVLNVAWGLDAAGEQRVFTNADLGYSYRHSGIEGIVWMGAVFDVRPDQPEAIQGRIEEITTRRETTQPIREKTGGSTFKNPAGHSSWKLVDEAGWRGKPLGGAMFSPLHANFLINTGDATAADLEGLGEAVRADVKARTGVELEWEIKRIGRPG